MHEGGRGGLQGLCIGGRNGRPALGTVWASSDEEICYSYTVHVNDALNGLWFRV
jgi:hypothetical protein